MRYADQGVSECLLFGRLLPFSILVKRMNVNFTQFLSALLTVVSIINANFYLYIIASDVSRLVSN